MAGRAPKMSRYEAEQALGLTGTYTYKDFQKAYRVAITSTHPDHGGSQEDAIRINEAKACLNYFFGDNKDATFTAADEATAAREQKEAHQAEQQQAAEEAVRQAAQEAYKHNGSEKDAPFTTCEYTKKPQSEWTQEDWDAFMAFQPPMSYKGLEYDVERMKSWNPDGMTDHDIEYGEFFIFSPSTFGKPHGSREWAYGNNMDVSEWEDMDWYYYWFTNARYPMDEGKVHTYSKTNLLFGPLAAKIRAEKEHGYYEKCQQYYNPKRKRVDTPYGSIDASSYERMSWLGNVGVPWIYALSTDYDSWLDMNIEAQEAALELYAEKLDITPAAARHRWRDIWRGTEEDIKEARESGFSGWQCTEEEVQTAKEELEALEIAETGGNNPISLFILDHLSGCRYALCALVYLYFQLVAVPSMVGGVDNMNDVSMKDVGGSMFMFLIVMVITWLAGRSIMRVVARLIGKVLGILNGRSAA